MTKKERKRRAEIASGPFGKHEALHVAYMMVDMFDDYLLSHPAVDLSPVLKPKAEAIMEALCGFYQLVGNENWKSESPD